MIKKWLFADPENALKKSYIWNMIASAINAAEAVVLLMIATRTVSISDVGVLTISFTVANLMMCIGKYGVRNFQVTDAKCEYSFKAYFRTRLVTLFIMLICLFAYLGFSIINSDYSLRKAAIVLLVSLIYGIEAFEDVFLSGLQHNGRLDSGAKMFSVRWIITLFVWSIALIFIRDALISTAIAFVADLLMAVVLIMTVSNESKNDSNLYVDKDICRILKVCFPLCVSMFLAIYLPNSAKYAIDACLNDEIQAYYGFIAMPIFVIDLVSNIIFQPLLVGMSQDWNNKEYSNFTKQIGKLCVLIFGLSVLVLFIGYFLGVPVLSWLYAVNLAPYKKEFMILLIGGVALGYIGLYTSVLTIIRKQSYLMGAYLVVSLITLFLINRVVSIKGILGATLANVVALLILAMILAIGALLFVYKKKNEGKKDD